MSAIPEEFLKKTAQLSAEVTKPFPKSQKQYVTGSRTDIRVPERVVEQNDTQTSSTPEKNPPIYIYDTSGPYTDPQAKIDLLKGLPALRDKWIEERGDTECLAGPTSEYGAKRQGDASLANRSEEHTSELQNRLITALLIPEADQEMSHRLSHILRSKIDKGVH